MEFNSRVRPQIFIGDDNTVEPIQSAFEKYNRHSHAFSNTGNPFEMGLKIGQEITFAGNETNIPLGTTIVDMFIDRIQLSTTSSVSLSEERFIVEGKFVLDNCSIDQGSDILYLGTQTGFINAEHLRLASSENQNGSIDLSTFNGLTAPHDYILILSSDDLKYITKFKVITDSVDEITFSLVLAEENIIINQATSQEDYFVFAGQSFSINSQVPENSIVYLRIHSVPTSVTRIFFHLKLNKVFL